MSWLQSTQLEVMGLGIYKSLTFIGIGIGVWILIRGMSGKTLWPFVLLLVGLFITAKELMDMMHYASFMNFVGVGVGVIVVILGITGTVLPPMFLALLGVFVAGKEVMDLLHSD